MSATLENSSVVRTVDMDRKRKRQAGRHRGAVHDVDDDSTNRTLPFSLRSLGPIYRTIPSAPPPPYPDFTPNSSDIRVNAFWFMSLALSLSAALLATLVQQSVRQYMHVFQQARDCANIYMKALRDGICRSRQNVCQGLSTFTSSYFSWASATLSSP